MSGKGSSEPSATVVGRHPVLEAVRSGLARQVLVAEGAADGAALREILDAARQAGIPVSRVPSAELARLAKGTRHQQVAARSRVPPTLTEADLASGPWPDDALALVLDGVTDPHNLGAAARTAEAAGVSVLVARRHRGAGITPAAVKASAGALLEIPLAHVANVARAIGRLQEAGFWVVGLDGGAEATVDTAERPPGRLALVVGAEGAGLSRLVREACDELLAIPMRGRLASLNVSVAAGVGLYTFALRGRPPGAQKQE
jgi:23S rRNA (guanosine2251-2'-O)-methyltransferase